MPPVNPTFNSSATAPSPDVDELFDGIVAGDTSALSQSITLIESQRDDHRERSDDLLTRCYALERNSFRIAITGIPGVGKSTLIEALGTCMLEDDHSVAVLAIDPSSQRSGGSILGDKTRMQTLAAHDRAFVRPSPTGGTLGGVSQTTREAIILCEAAGYDRIIIETVGVGQAEIAVHQMVDCFILLFIAGAGDGLQGIKRGIMEMADILAVNKADGDQKTAAASAQQTLQQALDLLPAPDSGWKPTVQLCSALENEGIGDLWETIKEFTHFVTDSGYFDRHRQEQRAHWFHSLSKQALLNDFYQNERVLQLLKTMEPRVVEGDITPLAASKEILSAYLSSPSTS